MCKELFSEAAISHETMVKVLIHRVQGWEKNGYGTIGASITDTVFIGYSSAWNIFPFIKLHTFRATGWISMYKYFHENNSNRGEFKLKLLCSTS